jgi:hypothetical protein
MKFFEQVSALGQPLEITRAEDRQIAREVRPASVQRSPFAFFRITPDATGTTTTSTTSTTSPPGSTTTTTSTTTTSTTTTTQPPCQSRLYFGVQVEVQFDPTPPPLNTEDTGVYRSLQVLQRDDTVFPLFATGRQEVAVHDIVAAWNVNGQWWIVARYTNCPQSSVTTTTTTSTTSTSTTTPAPKVWLQ